MRADDVCFARFFIVGKGRSCGLPAMIGATVVTPVITELTPVEIRAMMGDTCGRAFDDGPCL